MTTQKQKRRQYRLHYNLRRKGNKVSARERTVERRAKIVTKLMCELFNDMCSLRTKLHVCLEEFEKQKKGE
jgi:hypothetical protein